MCAIFKVTRKPQGTHKQERWTEMSQSASLCLEYLDFQWTTFSGPRFWTLVGLDRPDGVYQRDALTTWANLFNNCQISSLQALLDNFRAILRQALSFDIDSISCPSFPLFLGKEKTPKEQGIFIPTEPPIILGKEGKTQRSKDILAGAKKQGDPPPKTRKGRTGYF